MHRRPAVADFGVDRPDLKCSQCAAAEVFYVQTVDWMPTESVLAVPTTYLAASSYVVPTSSVVPTFYATAYVTESALVSPTRFIRQPIMKPGCGGGDCSGGTLVETSRAYYIPTTAYYPTTTTIRPCSRRPRSSIPGWWPPSTRSLRPASAAARWWLRRPERARAS